MLKYARVMKLNIKTDLFLTFAKIGAFTFGGGYAMISLIEHECCEKRDWLTHDEFMDMTVIAESTPGPIAINCATYVGFKKAGVFGAVLATLGMVLPSFVVISLISAFLRNFLEIRAVAYAFKGIRAAVAILIVRAGWRMISKMLKTKDKRAVNIAFVAMFFTVVLLLNFLNISFSTIYLILISGIAGFFVGLVPDGKEGKK